MAAERRSERRGDIQGLRAIAVLAVVVFHAFPDVLSGGFVGVDVFFVISGFLIAGILLREHRSTGTISLPRFWMRRVRRLVPATLVVASATLIMSAIRLDPIPLVRVFENGGWSLLSLANVHFANSPAGGYFANAVPNPFLHFWSLSVEEQFYLAFPILLVLVGFVRRSWVVPTLIGLVFVLSLTASVLLSAEHDPNAFYSLGTRAWELAIGAGLAWFVAASSWQPPRALRTAALALGLAAIVVDTLFYVEGMSWPGYAALLPTVGTALAIWSGTGGSAGPLARVLDNPVARYIGDVSFSFYLWHWPVLVLAPSALAGQTWFRVAAIVVAFGLAVATYHLVEQPFQRLRPQLSPARVLAIGLPLVVALAGTSFVAASVAMPRSGFLAEPLAEQYRTLDQGPGPVPAVVPDNVRPSLLDVGYDLQQAYDDCYGPGLPECWAGDADGDRVLLVTGDSYAGMFWPSLEQAAREGGWQIVLLSRAGCPLMEMYPGASPPATFDDPCAEWQVRALQRIEMIAPDAVLFINSAAGVRGPQFEGWAAAATAAVERIEKFAPVIVLGATPTFPATTEQCLGTNFLQTSACSFPVEQVLPQETRDIVAGVAENGGAELLDLTGILCDADGLCPMIAGDTLIYRDAGHISNAYSTHFATVFGDALRPYLD